MRIDVIVNRNARRYVQDPNLLGRVERVARSSGDQARVHVTGSIDELAAAIRAIARDGTDLVALSGGDGTFMAGATEIARAFGDDRLPRLALVPGGTVATIARNWGVHGAPDAVLARLLGRSSELSYVERPSLRVEETRRDGRATTRVGFIFGTGLVARFFDVYYARGAGGYRGAASIVARIFLESFWGGPFARRVLDPLPCAIEVDGVKLPPDAWSLVCAAVVRDLGIHMLVTHRAAEDPSRPHLVASALPARALGPRAPFVLLGRRIGGEDHFDDLVGSFTVRFPGESGPYVLDGDVLSASSVRVSAGPRLSIARLPA